MFVCDKELYIYTLTSWKASKHHDLRISIHTYASASFHVENVTKDPRPIEVEEVEPEVEYQEGQQPEEVIEVEEQELTNFDNT